MKGNQARAPLFEAIKRYVDLGIEPFHVPGHKYGRGLKDMVDFAGETLLRMDLNAMPDLDDICNPTGVIQEAQELAADLFGSSRAAFLLNGTTSGIHAMLLAAVRPGEEVLMPRNAHKSAFSGMILSGAVPVYLPVRFSSYGIPLPPATQEIRRALPPASGARALFVVHPNYYGLHPDIQSIVGFAHESGIAALVDEAHGCLNYFQKDAHTAMSAGADASAVSLHKTGGSMTQSSLLLYGGDIIPAETMHESLDILRSTSGSYPLMVSLDLARRQLADSGLKIVNKLLTIANKLAEINKRTPFQLLTRAELADGNAEIQVDPLRPVIHCARAGYSGFELERLLKSRSIQIEMADWNNIVLILGPGDTEAGVERLIQALETIPARPDSCLLNQSVETPRALVSPRDAFYSEKHSAPLHQAAGQVSGEMVMSYPPGIPLLLPGELISKTIVESIAELARRGAQIQGPADASLKTLRVLGR